MSVFWYYLETLQQIGSATYRRVPPNSLTNHQCQRFFYGSISPVSQPSRQIAEPITCQAGRVSTDDGLEEQLLSLAQVTQVTLPGSWMRATCDVAWRWLVLELRPVGF